MDRFPEANGALSSLPSVVLDYVREKIALCQPADVHVCDGSERENQQLLEGMEQAGIVRRLKKYTNW